MRKAIILGDCHHPWADPRAIRAAIKVIEVEKPKLIIQIGDLYDLFSYTKFSRSQNVLTPKEEVDAARKDAIKMWRDVIAAAPDAVCYQIMGNHDIRPIKRIMDKAPEFEHLIAKSWKELFKFPGVNTLLDARDDLTLDGIIYEHGFYSKPGMHCKENMASTVIGHTHRAWCHFEHVRGIDNPIWELNVGYLADPTQEPLSYTRKKHGKWTQGVGIVDNYGPRFCPVDWE